MKTTPLQSGAHMAERNGTDECEVEQIVTPQCYLGLLPVPQLVTIITCGSNDARKTKLKGLKA
jgi:hypothetical protein